VGRRAGLDGTENFAPTGIRSPDRRARSESLYRPGESGPLLGLNTILQIKPVHVSANGGGQYVADHINIYMRCL